MTSVSCPAWWQTTDWIEFTSLNNEAIGEEDDPSNPSAIVGRVVPCALIPVSGSPSDDHWEEPNPP